MTRTFAALPAPRNGHPTIRPGKRFYMIINIAVTSIPQWAAPLAPGSLSKWSSTAFMPDIR
jgi:hypothetical protein